MDELWSAHVMFGPRGRAIFFGGNRVAGTYASLPPVLRDKFQGLLRRIRLARWLRGIGHLLGIVVVLYTAAFCADWALGLNNLALRIWFLATLVAGAAVTLMSLVIPLSRRLEARALAGLMEKHYPELRERLSSAVELSQQRHEAHGAASLVAILCADAAQRTAALDIAPVFSIAPAGRRLGLAVTLMLLALVPAFVSSSYAYFGERFLHCWFSPLVGYALEVTPANAALAKGRPVTISVRLVSQDARVPLPKTCFLVLPDAMNSRQPMQAEGAQFSLTMGKLPGDLTYRIEAGELVSADFRLTAVEPVELAEGSPVIQVTPPPYVNKEIHPVQTSAASADFSALQFSMVRFDFRFNRPPVAVRVRLKKAGEEKSDWSEPALQWGPTRQDAFVEFPAAEAGSFSGSLVMEAEHGIATVQALPRWRAWPDEAPVFTQLPQIPAPSAGWHEHDNARPAAPHDAIALRATVEDQVGIERLEVEYRVNDGRSLVEEMAKGDGKLVLHSETTFKLIGKVKEGDVVRFRLRAWDNRRLAKGAVAAEVPERALNPHVIHEPGKKDGEDQWYILKITNQADPLQKQEIVAQRDDIRELALAIKRKLTVERGQLEKASLAAHSQPFLTPETTRALGQARAMNKDIVKDLALLGRKAMAEPALLALAERAFDIAESELGRSDQHLAKAEEKQLDAALREQQVKQADQELLKALTRLEELAKVNERLAQDRLDQLRMERLALQQEALGQRMKELAAKGPNLDQASKDELALLRAEQDEIARELDRLLEQSQLFKESLQKFRAAQAHQLAQKAQELAQAQRDLGDARQETMLRELKNRLADLARKQEDLAGRAEQMGQDARGKKPELHFPEAKGAAAALGQGKVAVALQAQEKTQGELARLADALEATAKEKALKARELAREQKALQEAVRKILEEVLGNRNQEPPDDRLAKLIQEQEEIAARAKGLATQLRQGGDDNAKNAEEAANFARQAANQAQTGAFAKAQEAGEKTARKLQDLAKDVAGKPEQSKEAVAMAQRQETLNEKWQELSRDVAAQKAQQNARQMELEKEVAKLTDDLMKLAQKAGTPEGMHGAKEAAQAAADAKKTMEQDGMKKAGDNVDQAKEMGADAAMKLELAAQKADQAADKMQAEGKSENDARDMTGKAIKDGQEQVAKSQNQLKDGPGADAQKAMQEAAKALQNAAKAAAQQMANASKGQAKSASLTPNPKGSSAGGVPGGQLIAKELEKYPGKSWGELPGELRTRIVQDLRARYGDDYAPIIQRYFQQIADVPNKR